MEHTESPRGLALSLLLRSEKEKTYSNIALDKLLSASSMSRVDKNLTSVLFYGVIERRLTLDWYIKKYASRSLEEIDLHTMCALRLGMYQLIYCDKIPPHAAINETVELCPKKTRGFVNAILRSYLRSPDDSLPTNDGSAEYLSVAYSVCTPLAKKLIEEFGFEDAEKYLKATFDPPSTTLRVNTLKTARDELLKRIPDGIPSEYSENGIYVKGAVRELYGFDEGLFFVQDDASQLCVETVNAKAGETVLDICACPGSKSFGMAIDMRNSGKVLSFDLHENKLSLVKSGAERLGINIIETSAADGRIRREELVGIADKILCDVPCSGFGVLAKKPELRYKSPSDSERLPDIQLAILENVADYLKDGGTLVYSTCTVFSDENENNIKRFLEKRDDFALCPFTVGGIECTDGYITLLPHVHRKDGFFIAKLKRK
ncbi:MAG: 16S rRNA (cytosine(967)-C(5))-methyltransferase RsmB [Clostridia bacterium]|nr:16S rRNA (cytosine(967)-C(5))-methyltransferase RsmB [Clostridia bacterium]